MRKDISINELELCNEYLNGSKLLDICTKYRIGKIKAKEILSRNNIKLRDRHSERIVRNFVVPDFHIKKYINTDSYYYVAKSKIDGTEYVDCNNDGGHLTSHIREKLKIEIPSLYDRRIYYQTTGNYWWEQWFDVEKREKKEVKKCPYCDWETVDIENKSGAFEVHLKEVHNKSLADYIKEFPDDIFYFKKYKKHIERGLLLENNSNFVQCPICGEKYEKLTLSHIKTHGISLSELKEKYPEVQLMSENMYKQTLDAQKLVNLTTNKHRFVSKYEKEIQEFLTNNNIKFETNRQILEGKEIDILIPDLKIGIEFDGLKWHTEWFGKKSHRYHLEKTEICNKHGYGLIHIFEDEYFFHKDIVFNKLSHILHLDNNKPKIMGRKCEIKQIRMSDAKDFLEKYHIQGYVASSIYLGAYYNDELVAVMTFKNGSMRNACWELSRFASNYNYICQGIGGKLFGYFVKEFKPNKIVSFADRRWTINSTENLYTKLGFKFDRFNPPDYKYYSDKTKDNNKYKRIHKMLLNKKKLHKKFGFPLTMTETEMAKELGYDRIWDCGLIKYVWERKRD